MCNAIQSEVRLTISLAFYRSSELYADVFNSISPEFPYGVVPQENSTFGSVVDTYDLLRSPKAGVDVFIRGEITLAVQHCLVTRKGLDRENIKRILSHEQVRAPTDFCEVFQ